MRNYLLFISILLVSCQFETRQDATKFYVETYNLNDSIENGAFIDWANKNLEPIDSEVPKLLLALDSIPVGSLYFSDSVYNVYGYCFGEFGGALFFQENNKEDSIYYLGSTCPVMIDKRSNGYYITESLAHLDGFGKVQFFKTPRELVRVHKDSLTTNWKEKMFPELDEYEIWAKLENQGEVLIDTVGLTFNMCFNHKDNDYLIYSDYGNTFLGRILTDSIAVLDTLLLSPSWRYNDTPNNIIKGFYHYNFKSRSGSPVQASLQGKASSGDIYVRNDTIIIAYE